MPCSSDGRQRSEAARRAGPEATLAAGTCSDNLASRHRWVLSRFGHGRTNGTTMSCMNNRSLTIRLDDELEQGLEAACADTGRSRGDIVRDALRRQLQLMRFERLRRQALPFGEAAGWLTDDDVFNAVS